MHNAQLLQQNRYFLCIFFLFLLGKPQKVRNQRKRLRRNTVLHLKTNPGPPPPKNKKISPAEIKSARLYFIYQPILPEPATLAAVLVRLY